MDCPVRCLRDPNVERLMLPPFPAVRAVVPGLVLIALLAALAFALRAFAGITALSPMILAVVLGALWRNTLGLAKGIEPGLRLVLRRLLRLGVVLLGLQLTLAEVAQIGVGGLLVLGGALVSTLVFTEFAGRWLRVSPGLTTLIATGTGICGASAVLAANSVVGAEDEDVAYAVAAVTVFGTASMLLLPVLGAALSPRDYGLWAGASIHEVAQVVAAGAAGGAAALAFASIAKLTRVALLVPVVLVLARRAGRQGHADFPWFVLGFAAMVGLASTGGLPEALRSGAQPLAQALLAMGMVAMGLQTDLARLRAKGLRPLALAALAAVFIAGVALLLVIATRGL